MPIFKGKKVNRFNYDKNRKQTAKRKKEKNAKKRTLGTLKRPGGVNLFLRSKIILQNSFCSRLISTLDNRDGFFLTYLGFSQLTPLNLVSLHRFKKCGFFGILGPQIINSTPFEQRGRSYHVKSMGQKTINDTEFGVFGTLGRFK